jgi:hypothetical protein
MLSDTHPGAFGLPPPVGEYETLLQINTLLDALAR